MVSCPKRMMMIMEMMIMEMMIMEMMMMEMMMMEMMMMEVKRMTGEETASIHQLLNPSHQKSKKKGFPLGST